MPEDRGVLDRTRRSHRLAPALAVLVVILGTIHAIRHVTPRVGDGSEYYALYFAWTTTGLPYETETSWAAYESFAAREPRLALVRRPDLTFPPLVQDGTADFNHAPFYSGLAALVGASLELASVHVHPRTAFVLLHAILSLALVRLAWTRRASRGVTAVLLLALTSPLLWFFDKVHTEYFTFCATTAAIVCVANGELAFASAWLGIASIQNPIFAACAALAVVLSLAKEPDARRIARKRAALAVAVVTSALYPGYFLIRIHHISPQLVAGGARLFAQADHPFAFFVDPDIGLLPNWPFGIVLVGFAVSRARRALAPAARTFVVFAIGFIALCLFAQVATENLNSGGTRDVSRYALWYVCLGYPIVDAMLGHLRDRRGPASIVVTGFVAANFVVNDPSLGERYIASTRLSSSIEYRIPDAYDPPVEIFAERYSTYGESVFAHRPLVVLGPRCRKLLVLRGQTGAPEISGRTRCNIDRGSLIEFLRRNGAFGGPRASDDYLVLDEDQLRLLRPRRAAAKTGHGDPHSARESL